MEKVDLKTGLSVYREGGLKTGLSVYGEGGLKTGLSVYGEGGLKNWVICIWRWIKILGYLYMEKVDITRGSQEPVIAHLDQRCFQ